MTIRALPAGQVEDAALKKGFRRAADKRDHVFFFYFLDDKKTRLFVKLSRGKGELRRDELKLDARTWGITGDVLFRILSCETDAAETEAIARKCAPMPPR